MSERSRIRDAARKQVVGSVDWYSRHAGELGGSGRISVKTPPAISILRGRGATEKLISLVLTVAQRGWQKPHTQHLPTPFWIGGKRPNYCGSNTTGNEGDPVTIHA